MRLSEARATLQRYAQMRQAVSVPWHQPVIRYGCSGSRTRHQGRQLFFRAVAREGCVYGPTVATVPEGDNRYLSSEVGAWYSVHPSTRYVGAFLNDDNLISNARKYWLSSFSLCVIVFIS